jgi:hypothetical protein
MMLTAPLYSFHCSVFFCIFRCFSVYFGVFTKTFFFFFLSSVSVSFSVKSYEPKSSRLTLWRDRVCLFLFDRKEIYEVFFF